MRLIIYTSLVHNIPSNDINKLRYVTLHQVTQLTCEMRGGQVSFCHCTLCPSPEVGELRHSECREQWSPHQPHPAGSRLFTQASQVLYPSQVYRGNLYSCKTMEGITIGVKCKTRTSITIKVQCKTRTSIL